MFQQKTKKKAPPRPPPPNFMKYKSKSTYNLNQTNGSLIEWSPPRTRAQERSPQFGGSISSSYSSSTSSLTSSKKSLENDNSLFNINSSALNWVCNNADAQPKDSSSALKPRIIRAAPPKKFSLNRDDSGTRSISTSLPMPKAPPPTLPKGEYEVVTPYGIALYDFPAAYPGDLLLQTNDIVELIRRVNKEWLYGRVCGREGIFPENFIHIEVPLPGEDQIVTALYEFKPEMASDLALKPGQRVKIIRKVSDDWFYGESEGRMGQFPKNYVSFERIQ